MTRQPERRPPSRKPELDRPVQPLPFAEAHVEVTNTEAQHPRETERPREATNEAEGRKRGEEAGGGRPGNDLLENDQPRGVDEEGRLKGGTHGGPKSEHRVEGQDPPDQP